MPRSYSASSFSSNIFNDHAHHSCESGCTRHFGFVQLCLAETHATYSELRGPRFVFVCPWSGRRPELLRRPHPQSRDAPLLSDTPATGRDVPQSHRQNQQTCPLQRSLLSCSTTQEPNLLPSMSTFGAPYYSFTEKTKGRVGADAFLYPSTSSGWSASSAAESQRVAPFCQPQRILIAGARESGRLPLPPATVV